MTAMPMSNAAVLLDLDAEVARITLDRPDSLNSMSPGLMDDLAEAIRSVDARPDVRVLVLTGKGRGFCAGADLTGEVLVAGNAAASVPKLMDEHFHPAMRALMTCRVPTVARVNGPAAGGGLALVLACDLAIAARSAFFVAPFGPRLGIVPDLGTTWLLPRCVGRSRALALSMLGERLGAEEAAAWGMIHRAVPDADLDAEVGRLTEVLARSSTEAMVRIRASIDAAAENGFDEQLDLERDHQRVLIPRNVGEGVRAFRERRDPDFRGT